MDLKNSSDVLVFITKHGSEIHELLTHRNSAIRHQSFAEARLPIDAATHEHFHVHTEEIYLITHGTGWMHIEGEETDVRPGDALAIPPVHRRKLWNTRPEPPRLSFCCAPPCEHGDTLITEK